ncbi:MAG: hypothetical protein LBU26_04735, partial [Synergistaceae bacterium]|nr:hypothetical protein [Synergistaceae bacterium]
SICANGASLRRVRLAAAELSVFVRYGYRYGGECGYFSDAERFPDPVSSDMELVNSVRSRRRKQPPC